MNEEPIEAKDTFQISFNKLLEWSIEEWKKRMGMPYKDLTPWIVEADQPQADNSSPRDHIPDAGKLIQDTKGEHND